MEEGDVTPAEDTSNVKDNKDEDDDDDETENAVRVHRGLGAILANIAGGNRRSKENGENKKPPPLKVNVPKPQPQEQLGFDLNSMGEFSGWGDLSASSGANTEPLNTSLGNDKKVNRFNREANVPKQQPKDNLGLDFNSLQEFSGWGDLASGGCANNEPLSSQKVNHFDRGEGNRRKSTNAGFKRDVPQGQAEDNKRFRQANDSNQYNQADDKMSKQDMDHYDYSLKEVTSWADMCQYNDDHDSAWFADENKRLAEEYGGTFISVKYIEGQQGKVGYYCELCQAEMNARKSLELHCGGMKHLKKKNLWEKNKGNPDADEQPEEPKPLRPVRVEPKTRGGGRPGRKPGPPPRGQLLPPAAFGRCKERDSRPDRDRPGYKRIDPFGRDHSRFEQRSQGLRNQNDQGGFGRRENHRGDRRPFNNPHNDRRGDTNRMPASRFSQRNPPPFTARAPPPATPAPHENFSGGPTGVLVKRLSDCCVKSADDAKLATEVISLLLKSLKEFQQKKGDDNSVLLLQEAEVKFNIMKALQSTSQTGRVNSNPGHVQNEPRPIFNQVQRFPAQNYYLPPAGPGYQMGNGQVHYSAPPIRYNK